MAMLDATEKQIMENWESFTVEFTRVAFSASHTGAWKVSYRAQAKADGPGHLMVTGGGTTLRQAMQEAFKQRMSARLDR
jgi:hypothetical protein